LQQFEWRALSRALGRGSLCPKQRGTDHQDGQQYRAKPRNPDHAPVES